MKTPKLYSSLAPWFHLVTDPRSYAGEARFAARLLMPRVLRQGDKLPSLLELGSGGGNNALHLKKQFVVTLTDVSAQMLAQSRLINTECEHIVGDMRTLRLELQFDAVLVHDAVMYMTHARDLARAIKTAFVHCKPGGVALFQPDFVRETFTLSTARGGHAENGRAARYVETQRLRGASSTLVDVDYEFTLTERGARTRIVRDHHVVGAFPRHVASLASCGGLSRSRRARSVEAR